MRSNCAQPKTALILSFSLLSMAQCSYTRALFTFYCKRAILFLSSSKILTPHPPLRPGEDTLAGRIGGSIFWKTRVLGLHSYSKICTLWRYWSAQIDGISLRPSEISPYFSGFKIFPCRFFNAERLKIASIRQTSETCPNAIILYFHAW
jgi:hypothetical protein